MTSIDVCLDISIRLQTSKMKLKEELREIFVIQMIVKGIIFLITKLCFKLRRGNNSIENKANHMDIQINTMESQRINENNKISLENK